MRFGWRPDIPDQRDYKFSSRLTALAELPPRIDLTAGFPAAYDQGDLGSCTAQSGGGIGQFLLRKERKKDFLPSFLALYYWTREIEGTVNEDSGAYLRDTMKVLASVGLPPASLWWYNVKKYAVKPNKRVIAAANKHRLFEYYRLDHSLDQMKTCLAQGCPFMFGFAVYDSFRDVGRTGFCPMPRLSERLLGGHAVVAVGYDDATRQFTVRNSWGTSWGLNGYFKMPYDYLLSDDLSADFWMASRIE